MEVDDDAIMAQNNASTTSDDASMIIDVAPDGDIIMVVGPEQRKFRGRQLRNNSQHGEITKIKLPEDNADGMGTIFYLLHHRVDKIPDSFSALVLFQVGVAANKYDLVVTLKHTITGAIHRTINDGRELKDMRMLDVWYLAITAACFDDAANFATLTLTLVWYYGNAFVWLAEMAAIDDSLAYRSSGLLEMERSKIRSDICQEVLLNCSGPSERFDGILTKIDWPYVNGNKWDVADILTKGTLHSMWAYVDQMDLKFQFMDEIYIDEFTELPWMKAIRKTGTVSLKNARKT
ncbi:BTB/POZ domain-containing protein [Colletotrichum camelliae]|nr:BTB/POZ domain-containing protein [Colletotrichum camelliae]